MINPVGEIVPEINPEFSGSMMYQFIALSIFSGSPPFAFFWYC
jgi:hypothetical protein